MRVKKSISVLLLIVFFFGSIPNTFAAKSFESESNRFVKIRKRISQMLRKGRAGEQRIAQLKRQLKKIRQRLQAKKLNYISINSEPETKVNNISKKSLSPVSISISSSSDEKSSLGSLERGQASYYASMFDGRRTASGDIFYNSKLTAAHRSLAFGTVVKVTNVANQKSVIVTINDRGPYVNGRIIDLSASAFGQLDNLSRGVINVSLEILE